MKDQRRARPGGEIGANGEHYEGGKFIATTDRSKGTPAKRGSGKQETAPYKWELPPTEGACSLFAICGACERWNHDAQQFSFNEQVNPNYAGDEATRRADIAAYNSGKRWKEAGRYF